MATSRDYDDPSALSGRLVTFIENYALRGRWKVWSVLQSKIINYETPSGSGDASKPPLEFPLSADQFARIRDATAKVPKVSKGMHWYTSDVMDGSALTIRFSNDGQPCDSDICLVNVWRQEFSELYGAVSDVLPYEKRMMFRENVGVGFSESYIQMRDVRRNPNPAKLQINDEPWWKRWS